jgi:rhodanese-related sulfurtransferase
LLLWAVRYVDETWTIRRTMRRTFALLALSLVWMGVAAAAAPQIAVDLATYNFPDTVEGLAVAHTFILSNVGDEELVIESAGPTCHCTKITTELEVDRLQPGQSVTLHAVLDTNGLSGRSAKQIVVLSNDPTRQPPNQLALTFLGNVTERQPYQTPVGDLFYDSYLLLDVREPDAYAAGHLVGAMNVPASQIALSSSDLPPTALTIFYDQNGASSTLSEVTQLLLRAGFTAVYALQGGLDQWERSFGPVRMTSGADASWGAFLDVSGAQASSGSATVERYYAARLLTDYVLIDIRSASAFAAWHLAGAVNLAEANLASYIDRLPQETPIIVYSADGVDSDRVVYSLWMRGSRAKSLLGGIAEWQRQHGDLLIVASAG